MAIIKPNGEAKASPIYIEHNHMNKHYKSATTTRWEWQSTLENGHTVPLKLAVGDVHATQWGPRKVVGVKLESLTSNRFDDWDNYCQ